MADLHSATRGRIAHTAICCRSPLGRRGARLRALIDDYAPREVALPATSSRHDRRRALLDEVRALAALAERAPLQLIAGNHDAQLPQLLKRTGIALESHANTPPARTFCCTG